MTVREIDESERDRAIYTETKTVQVIIIFNIPISFSLEPN